jgi:hypothetical protein
MLLVIGGQARKVGKTSVAAGVIRRLRERRWTAIKITRLRRGAEAAGAFEVREEQAPGAGDSGRMLMAGAARALWVRVPDGAMARAAEVARECAALGDVLVESTSVMEALAPDLFLMAMDLTRADLSTAAARFMDRADGAVVTGGAGLSAPWKEVAGGLWEGRPRFVVEPPDYDAAEVAGFVNWRSPAPSAR